MREELLPKPLPANVGQSSMAYGMQVVGYMLAFVQGKITSTVLAAFPTTNDLSGSFTARYNLTLIDSVTPNTDQPQAYPLALSGEARPGGAVGHGVAATYTLGYQNAGNLDIQDVVRISVTIPSNLDATCSDISGDYNTSLSIADQGGGVCVVPVSQGDGPYFLPAGASGTITLTGTIKDVAPTGPVTVTGHIFGDCPDRPDINDSDNWAYPWVVVDATPPDPEFSSGWGLQMARMNSAPGTGVGSGGIHSPLQSTYIAPTATVLGLAADNRSGVTRVEVDLDDGQGWRDASGTTVWNSLLSGLNDGDTRTLKLRATDAAGNRSAEKTLHVTVDGLPPQSTISNPPGDTTMVLGEEIALSGTSNDARPGVSRVDVSTDGGEDWSPAGYSSGAWMRNWQPRRTGRYTITVRAVDAVGNWETPDQQVIVTVTSGGDDVGPQIGTPSFDSIITSTESLAVTADISDALTGGNGVAQATLHYGYTAPYNGSQVTGTGPGGTGPGVWHFVVPPQGESHEDDTLYFFITAEDSDATPATTTNNNGGNYFQVQIVAAESKIYLPLVTRNHQR